MAGGLGGARSVLVTGANRGIGLELVRQLVSGPDPPPQHLFACCRQPDGERGQDLKKLVSSHPNVTVVKLDTTNPATIEEAAVYVEEQLKGLGLNVLINNAATYTTLSLDTVGPEDMLNEYKTNVVGPLLVSQAFVPLLKRAAKGSTQKGLSCSRAAIINISSSLGSIELVPTWYATKPAIPYRCSKAALNTLTKCQSLSYMEDGILCTAIHPGWVKTDMGTQDASMTVDESVEGILNVLSKLDDENNGFLINWKGKKLPW